MARNEFIRHSRRQYVTGALAIVFAIGLASAVEAGAGSPTAPTTGIRSTSSGAGHKGSEEKGKSPNASGKAGAKGSHQTDKGKNSTKARDHLGVSSGKPGHSKSARAGHPQSVLSAARVPVASEALDAKMKSAAASARAVAPTKDTAASIALPARLRPVGRGGDRPWRPFASRGAPGAVVQACHDAIESAAISFGVVSVRAKSAGSLRHVGRGMVSAPVDVRIRYQRRGGVEVRQARIRCHLDATGKVLKLT